MFVCKQNPFDKPANKQVYERWLSGQGHPCIFVYHQKKCVLNEQGELVQQREPADFIVTDGKCLLFRQLSISWRNPFQTTT